ncbi:MAG: biopolymer transporter ExbD [Candidatus Omnitrophica bacterium]|nr:biopolymer transporter ExbD [Candidatus Omnitrophota bacterium]
MRIPVTVQRKRARIEIIPLIDIIFFLLATFVMVSLSMVKNQGIVVKLPTAVTGGPEDRKLSVTVSISEAGQLYLDKEAMSMEILKSRLNTLKNENSKLTVFVNGDERADFGKAIEVFDQIRQLGITKVSVQTKGKK